MRNKDPKDMTEAEKLTELAHQEDFFQHLVSHLPEPPQPLTGWRKSWSHFQGFFDWAVKVFVGTFLWLVAASVVFKIIVMMMMGA